MGAVSGSGMTEGEGEWGGSGLHRKWEGKRPRKGNEDKRQSVTAEQRPEKWKEKSKAELGSKVEDVCG